MGASRPSEVPCPEGAPGVWAAPLHTARRVGPPCPRPHLGPSYSRGGTPFPSRAGAGLGRLRGQVPAAVSPRCPPGPPRTSWRPPAAGSIFNSLTGGGPAPGSLA